MLDEQNGWAVGTRGAFARTTDGGVTWLTQPKAPVSVELAGVWAADESHIWAVGPGHTILRFDGTKWISESVPTAVDLFGIWGVDKDNLWVVGSGGNILRRVDGVWTAQNLSGQATLRSICGVSATEMFAVGDLGVTMKGDGVSWSVVPSGVTSSLYAVYAASSGKFWAVGTNGVIRRWNGTSWVSQTSPATNAITAIWIADDSNVWIAGTGGFIARWDGASWFTESASGAWITNALHGTPGKTVYAAGSGRTILKRSEGAWKTCTGGTGDVITAVTAVGGGVYWGATSGNSGMALRWAGNVWEPWFTGTRSSLTGIWASGPNAVWAIGDGRIVFWDGNSWTNQTSPRSSGLRSIKGLSDKLAWVVGDGGTILRWNGSTWANESTGVASLLAVWPANASNVWAVGAAGTILKWNGTSWTSQVSGTTVALRAVWGSGTDDVWAVGDNGIATHWNGIKWTPVPTPVLEPLNGIWGIGSDDVWVIGNAGRIIHWDGASWSARYSPVVSQLSAIDGVSKDDFKIVGQGGVAIRITSAFSVTVTNGPLTSTSAVMRGQVNGYGEPVSAWFEYGTSPALGSVTAPQFVDDSAPRLTSLTVNVPNLIPHTRYYYHLRTENYAGMADGGLQTFVTLNSTPTILNPTKSLPEDDSKVSFAVEDLAADADGDKFSIEILSVTGGTVVANESGITFSQTQNSATLSFAYKVDDGFGGVVNGVATIKDTTAPLLSVDAVPRTGYWDADLLPDLRGTVSAYDNSGFVVLTQSPAPGTRLSTGTLNVAVTATDPALHAVRLTFDITTDAALATKSVLASSGSPVPGGGSDDSRVPAGSRWLSFGAPSASGHSWLANVRGGAGVFSGIFTNGGAKLLLRTGDTVPDGVSAAVPGLSFKSFRDPVFATPNELATSATCFAVQARVVGAGVSNSNNTGIWAVLEAGDSPSSLSEIARKGGIAPGAGTAVFSTFVSVAMPDSRHVYLVAKLKGSKSQGVTVANDLGIWVKTFGQPMKAALREGDDILVGDVVLRVKSFSFLAPIHGSPGYGRYATSGGRSAIFGTISFSDGRSATAQIDSDGVVRVGTLAEELANQEYSPRSIGVPDRHLPDGEEAFSFAAQPTAKGGPVSLLRAPSNIVVRTGDLATGTNSAAFGIFGNPIATSVVDRYRAFAFASRLTGPGIPRALESGVWLTRDNPPSLEMIVRCGEPLPGVANAKLLSISKLASVPGRGPVIACQLKPDRGATLAGPAAQGIWGLNSRGRLRSLVRFGDLVSNGSESKSLSRYSLLEDVAGSPSQRRSVGDGKLLYRAYFTDRSQAIVSVDIP